MKSCSWDSVVEANSIFVDYEYFTWNNRYTTAILILVVAVQRKFCPLVWIQYPPESVFSFQKQQTCTCISIMTTTSKNEWRIRHGDVGLLEWWLVNHHLALACLTYKKQQKEHVTSKTHFNFAVNAVVLLATDRRMLPGIRTLLLAIDDGWLEPPQNRMKEHWKPWYLVMPSTRRSKWQRVWCYEWSSSYSSTTAIALW